jgi:hypothetical protein
MRLGAPKGPDMTTTATAADAALLTQVMALGHQLGMYRGMQILFGYAEPPTAERLRADHPVDGTGYADVMSTLMIGEMLGTYVKHGLLDRALVHDLLWVEGIWRRVELLVGQQRAELDEDLLYENFEALAKVA